MRNTSEGFFAAETWLMYPPAWVLRARRVGLLLFPVALPLYSLLYGRNAGIAHEHPWLVVVASVAAGLSLYLVTRAPEVPAVAAAVAWMLSGSAVFVMVMSFLLTRRRSRFWWFWLIGFALLHPLGLVPDPYAFRAGHALLPLAVVSVYAVVVPALIGLVIALWHRLAEARIAQAEQRAAIERVKAQAASAAQRVSLSRDMHDVIGQQLSRMVMRANALNVTSSDPETRAAAAAIATIGAETVEDLHIMISMLRDRETRPERSDTVESIIAEAVRDGLHVQYVDPPAPVKVDHSVHLLVVATVREALHNASKHAPGATCAVFTKWSGPASVQVRVESSAALRAAVALPTGGFGLEGIAERSRELGGSFTAAPTTSGGFIVELRLPA